MDDALLHQRIDGTARPDREMGPPERVAPQKRTGRWKTTFDGSGQCRLSRYRKKRDIGKYNKEPWPARVRNRSIRAGQSYTYMKHVATAVKPMGGDERHICYGMRPASYWYGGGVQVQRQIIKRFRELPTLTAPRIVEVIRSALLLHYLCSICIASR
jgi:hypothetical protein